MFGAAMKERKKENRTGIPTQLKERMEQNTGLSFDDVRVHYNSALPAKLDALAYTRGNQVEVGPGQERHLPHELGHVVQQKLGIVRANAMHSSGMAMNTDAALEHQADEIGAGNKVAIVQRMQNQDPPPPPPPPPQPDSVQKPKPAQKPDASQNQDKPMAEEEALQIYTSEAFRKINGPLRSGEQLDSYYQKAVEALERMIDGNRITEEMILHRRASIKALEELKYLAPDGKVEHIPPEQLIGKTITEKAFMSTSKKIEPTTQYKGDIDFTIRAPQGARAADIGSRSLYESEDEVLFAPGQKLLITSAVRELLAVDILGKKEIIADESLANQRSVFVKMRLEVEALPG